MASSSPSSLLWSSESVDWKNFSSTFEASIRSVGTACTLTAVGVYLHRRGYIVGEGKRTLALISQQVTIPLLFFTKIMYCNQNWSDEPCPDITSSLRDVWILILWPAYVVGCGLLLGWIAAKLSNTPKDQWRAVLCACAFGNSTGLPITLLTVVHANFPKSSDLGRIDPTLFLSVYLLLYPVLQWGVGGWLMAPDPASSTRTKIDEEKLPKTKRPRRRRSNAMVQNVLNEPTTPFYKWNHRGMGETDASMYMSVQDNLYRLDMFVPPQGQTLNNINYHRNDSIAPTTTTSTVPTFKDNNADQSIKKEDSIGMDLSSLSNPETSGTMEREKLEKTTTTFSGQESITSPSGVVITEQTSLLAVFHGESDTLYDSEKNEILRVSRENQTIQEDHDYDNDDKCDNASASSASSFGEEIQCWETTKQVLSRCLQPPVIGALLGLLIASQPSWRGIFVDMVDRSGDAPLEWMFDALYSVGQAAVPINMMILGMNLSASFRNNKATNDDDEKDKSFLLFTPQTTLAVILAKMIFMPIVGIVSAIVFRQLFWLNIPDEIQGSFYLVVLIVFLTPTANNIMVMVELGAGNSSMKQAMARLIAWQYALAPLLLSLTMTVAVGIADKWS